MKNRVSEFRKNLHLSQTDLADLVGVNRNTISAIERGIFEPRLKLAFKIAICLGKTVPTVFELTTIFDSENQIMEFLKND